MTNPCRWLKTGYYDPMSACLDHTDVIALSEVTLSESAKRIGRIPENLCAPFNDEARALELELLNVYRTVAVCVKKEDDMAAVAVWWETMTGICDVFSKRLHELHSQHPYCGADVFYDRVLDLRNKCQRLQEMHLH